MKYLSNELRLFLLKLDTYASNVNVGIKNVVFEAKIVPDLTALWVQEYQKFLYTN